MVRTRSRIYSTYILLLDKSLLFHERFISRRSLDEKITDSIIASNKDISIDPAYDEMISELLDEFPIRGWRTYLLNCLNDEILDKQYSSVTNTIFACRYLYYYGLPGEEHDQDLFTTKFPNTRDMFLTNFLRNVINSSCNFIENPNHTFFDEKGKQQVMKLIEHCRIKNNWGKLSFFDNTLR